MALSDSDIGLISIDLKKTLKKHFLDSDVKEIGNPENSWAVTDSELADYLLCVHPESLNDRCPEKYLELVDDDKHRVIERALSSLLRGNGLSFDNNDNATWIRVSIAHEGRTPLGNTNDYRWIRLSSIDQVIPKLAFGASENERSWGWNLQVKTNGGDTFYASDETYRGNLINNPLNALIHAITKASNNQPAPLGKL